MDFVFDDKIAASFNDHARKHIPNYDVVIDKTLVVCKYRGMDSKIIDVGCAIGETLNRLANEGFRNLYGVDNSQSMLDKCSKDFTLVLSDTFPEDSFDVIICNWTLHFIKEKRKYLEKIFDNLNKDGIFVLTEKTSISKYALNFYHDFKRDQGCTEEEIKNKEESVKNIMFIDSVEWYLHNLKEIGFTEINIIDSYWCFNTFVCTK